jgi:hypothetical protein
MLSNKIELPILSFFVTMADLHPTITSPLEHTYKLIKFTCSGEGLYKDLPKKFFTPKTTKTESEPKEVGKKPVAFWKAQCAFRGLNQNRSDQ